MIIGFQVTNGINDLFLIFVKKQSQELTRVNPDRNIFLINVEIKYTFLLYRGLVHHHRRILRLIITIISRQEYEEPIRSREFFEILPGIN